MTTCFVYRSDKRDDTYLFLPPGQKFDDLDEALRTAFGEPVPVMKLDVNADTRLAQADAGQVLKAFEEQGYFLQRPPRVSVEDLITRRFG
jgi:uncharacterized protein YcgL (UPF0745 family)